MTKARDIASAAPAPSTVSATEIGYLDGVSSAIQTQLDAKVAKSLVDAKGDLLVGSANDTVSRLAVASTAGYVLTVDSAEATGLKWAATSSPSYVGASVYKTANQSTNNSTYTLITFDAEFFDTDGIHSTVTNTSRMTIPNGKGGKYLVSGSIGWVNNATGYRIVELMNNASNVAYFQIQPLSGADATTLPISYVINVAAGDYLELRSWQNSGGALNIQGNSSYSTFQITYLGA